MDIRAHFATNSTKKKCAHEIFGSKFETNKNFQAAFETVRLLKKEKPSIAISPITDSDGDVLMNFYYQLTRWADFYEEGMSSVQLVGGRMETIVMNKLGPWYRCMRNDFSFAQLDP